MSRRRRNGARSATLHFVLEDRRVDEILERAIGLERLMIDLQAQAGRAEARLGQAEAAIREIEEQRDRAGLDERRRIAAAAGKASQVRRRKGNDEAAPPTYPPAATGAKGEVKP